MPAPDQGARRHLVEQLRRATIVAAFGWRRAPDDWVVEKLPIVGGLPDEFRRIASGAATDLRDKRGEAPYTVEGRIRDNEFAYLPYTRGGDGNSASVGGNLIPRLADYGNAPDFSDRSRSASPSLYAIVASLPNGEQAIFGRRLTGRNVLKQTRGVRTLFSHGTFSRLEEGNVVTFDDVVDWIAWRVGFLILDDESFHRTFRDLEALRAAVQEQVDKLTGQVAIHGAQSFVDRCRKSPQMMAKLERVVDQELYLKPVEELRAYTEHYPELGVEWSGDALVFDGSLEKQWTILNLFDEVGFTGGLSGLKFEAPTKRPLS